MSRMHFEALAAQLALTRPDRLGDVYVGPGDLDQWRSDCYGVAKACASFNDGFDFDRFMECCNA